METTLVLSPGYEPVARVHWQRAITLLFMGKVEVVEEYDDKDIHSVTFAIKMPSVVRFLKAIRVMKKAIKFSRENVYSRDGGRCQYCDHKITRAEVTYDHVVPRSQGGKTDWLNIVSACVPCNQKKGGRTPEQAGMKLRSRPHKPKKLPDVRIVVTWDKNMPNSWKSYFRDMSYWHGELDHDD